MKTKYYDHWYHARGWDDDALYENQQFPDIFALAMDKPVPAGTYLYARWCLKERPLPRRRHEYSDKFKWLLAEVNAARTALFCAFLESDDNAEIDRLQEELDNARIDLCSYVEFHKHMIVWRD